MELSDRIRTLSELGEQILVRLNHPNQNAFGNAITVAHIYNPWFTPENCQLAIKSIAQQWLTPESLKRWVDSYPISNFETSSAKRIAVIMAGNIPFVSLHDLLCVLITGNHFVGKTSSKDSGLMQALIDLLVEIEPRFTDMISISDGKIENFDAVIATGSDNTSRYFEYYFGKYPNIIRKNRHSIALLSGDEKTEDLDGLASDIFTYFGLGCRNVSKILVPTGYDFIPLLQSFEKYQYLINHSKYANNYEYHRAMYLMNRIEHLDTGYLLIKADDSLGSPVGTIFYQFYKDIESAMDYTKSEVDNLQCVVSSSPLVSSGIAFGQTQQPLLSDYADGVDTIEFLAGIAN